MAISKDPKALANCPKIPRVAPKDLEATDSPKSEKLESLTVLLGWVDNLPTIGRHTHNDACAHTRRHGRHTDTHARTHASTLAYTHMHARMYVQQESWNLLLMCSTS